MNNEEYRKLIYKMIESIEDRKILKRIFFYIHKFFIRGAGK